MHDASQPAAASDDVCPRGPNAAVPPEPAVNSISGVPDPAPTVATGAAIELTRAQHAALSALTAGKSIRAAAGAAGVHRVTVARWLHDDPRFRAAYNAWRQELVDLSRARLLQTAVLATLAVRKAIERGDGRLALALLDRLGLTTEEVSDPGPADAEVLRDEMAVRAEERRIAIRERVHRFRYATDGPEDR